jgi:Ca-activated chloride channel family protein
VVVTDGIDNASAVTADDVVRQAEQRDMVVFAVGLFGATEKNGLGRHELDQLTDKTGGVAYVPASIDDIGPVALEIARQIRNQYTIAYESTNKTLDGSYRTIRVAVTGRGQLTVRAIWQRAGRRRQAAWRRLRRPCRPACGRRSPPTCRETNRRGQGPPAGQG